MNGYFGKQLRVNLTEQTCSYESIPDAVLETVLGGMGPGVHLLSEEYILTRSAEGAGAMVIGPAGENLVRFESVKSDRWRSVGRGGMGALPGSKNAKGIFISGRQKPGVANEQLLNQIIKDLTEKTGDNPVTQVYRMLGTPSQVEVPCYECG